MDKQQLLENIREVKARALTSVVKLEAKIEEKSKQEFQAWKEMRTTLSEIEQLEKETVEESRSPNIDEELEAIFSKFVQQIIEENFTQLFYESFNEFVEKDLKRAYEQFLSNKKAMMLILQLRKHIQIMDSRLEEKMEKKCKEVFGKEMHLLSFQEFKKFIKIKKQIENSAFGQFRKLVNDFVEQTNVSNESELYDALALGERLIEEVSKFVDVSVHKRLSDIIQEHKTISTFAQNYLRDKLKEKKE